MSGAAQLVVALYDDPEECARLAKLRYVSPDDPGLRRVRRGRGFSYQDATGVTIEDPALRGRIAQLAIPPAWRNVWICTATDGHILAVGEDDRGRRQYIYHERWRALRDRLNFHRLVGFGERLPTVRADVERQLRRRSFDADRVLAAMLRVIDVTGLRVGNEVYAEENDSYGLSTLTRRHVQVHGACAEFRFPAKSGRPAEVSITDAGVARVVSRLRDRPGRYLFRVDGTRIDADEMNARLAELTGAHYTAKDFRTWHGTVTAFKYLRARLPTQADAERHVLDAVDAAAEALGNTRAIARDHYVHPDVVAGYISGDLERFLAGRRARGTRWLDGAERLLLGYLTDTLDRQAGELRAA
ncbi:MAG TPA: DNA topoisomerase IB [Jatrophihabitans sp.]|nr:DNA topoisomerase IB [Jatrophihabitans sp.]